MHRGYIHLVYIPGTATTKSMWHHYKCQARILSNLQHSLLQQTCRQSWQRRWTAAVTMLVCQSVSVGWTACSHPVSAVLSVSLCSVLAAAAAAGAAGAAGAGAQVTSWRARSYARRTAATTFALLFAVNLTSSSSSLTPRGSSFLRGNQRLQHTPAPAILQVWRVCSPIHTHSSAQSHTHVHMCMHVLYLPLSRVIRGLARSPTKNFPR